MMMVSQMSTQRRVTEIQFMIHLPSTRGDYVKGFVTVTYINEKKSDKTFD